ncbi:MAG: type I-U CRISPR-associated helicase/endonuclease Cas3 [Planctomycetes bacterium]|nr:type I-U CRISPR-associated helicase/endonuclease Cas3 [Planctomycetota bacterium]
MTTIRDKLPGRPPVEPYLHGIEEWQPPETQVAWREDVDVIKGDMLEQYDPKDLLEDYPLKPHELLRDRSDRVFKAVATLAHEHPEANVWLVEPQGAVSPPLTLRGLADGEVEAIHGMTVILPPSVGGLSSTGTLDGAAARKAPAGPQKDDDAPPISPAGPRLDVADEWWEDKDRTVRRRIRVWSDDPDREQKLERMRLVRRIAIPTSEDDEDAEPRTWEWYARPRSADDDGSMAAREATTLDNHMRDVEAFATAIARAELKDKSLLREAVILAARFHDLGKHRAKWQRGIGNDEYPTRLYAKSGLLPDGTRLKPRDVHSDYRHEFGSLLDIQAMPEFRAITDEHLRDLVLHLVAAHHGRARPHFPADEADDPEPRGRDVEALAAEIPRRFARLQRRYGRWGLAYLESLLRAADYAASANPSVALEEAQGVPS